MKYFTIIQLLSALSWAPLAAAGVRGARALQLSTRKITTFHEVKLTPKNEVLVTGVENGSGVAVVQLDYNDLRVGAKWKVCIQSDIHGFTPGQLQLHKGKISASGLPAVDFSSMLSDNDPFFDGCVKVNQIIFNDILENPVRRDMHTWEQMLL